MTMMVMLEKTMVNHPQFSHKWLVYIRQNMDGLLSLLTIMYICLYHTYIYIYNVYIYNITVCTSPIRDHVPRISESQTSNLEVGLSPIVWFVVGSKYPIAGVSVRDSVISSHIRKS